MEQPESPPPEAVLIRRARQAQALSPEQIVRRMTRGQISARYWRQIEDGQRTAPEETIAHMAHTADVSADQLAQYRPEAAAILREIRRQEQEPSVGATFDEEFRDSPDLQARLAGLSKRRRQRLLERYAAMRERARAEFEEMVKVIVEEQGSGDEEENRQAR